MHSATPFADSHAPPFIGTIHRAYIYDVHDGDTLWPVIDLGFGIHHSNPEKGIRLVGPGAKGFNTFELNDPDPTVRSVAQAARDRVITLAMNEWCYVESWPPTTDDKYGRWLMAVYLLVTPPAMAVPLGKPPAYLVTINGVKCYDLASQLVAESLGVWKDFG